MDAPHVREELELAVDDCAEDFVVREKQRRLVLVLVLVPRADLRANRLSLPRAGTQAESAQAGRRAGSGAARGLGRGARAQARRAQRAGPLTCFWSILSFFVMKKRCVVIIR